MSYFSKNISYLLENGQTTVNDLLKITNHNSAGLVSMWKSGERTPITEDVLLIANHLNLTVDELLNNDLTIKNNNRDELIDLFVKNRSLLTKDDEDYIKFIFDKRKKENMKK